MKYIIGCRHGEANKNLNGIFGGNGSSLTNKGITQIQEFINNITPLILSLNLPINLYASGDRKQINESAEIIRQAFNIDIINKNSLYKPIKLGVFDGMNREKQQVLYPDACEAQEQWEQGLIDVKEVEKLVEGMQKAKDYFDQLTAFLRSIPDDTLSILVGTRSDLSCLENIIRGQDPDQFRAYKYYKFGYAQSTLAQIDENEMIRKKELSTQDEQLEDLIINFQK